MNTHNNGFQTQISFTQPAADQLTNKLHFQHSAPNYTVGAARDSQEFGGKRIGGKGGSRIKVAVRIRPLLDSEMNQGHSSTCVKVDEQGHHVQ